MRNCEFERAKSVYTEPEVYSWNYRFLSVFINQLIEYEPDPKIGFRKQKSSKKGEYFFYKINI